MGLFTFGVSAILVVFQCTVLLLQREACTWSLSMTFARPNASEWMPELNALLGLSPPLAASTPNNNTANASAAHHLQLALQETPSLLCLRILSATPSDTNAQRQAASCLLRTHVPAHMEPVLRPWNPHLLLLTLCALQCLFALGRMYRNRSHYYNSLSEPPHPYISLQGAGGVLTGVLVAAGIVQGVHDGDLVQYPTLVVMVLLWFHGWAYATYAVAWDDDVAWSLFYFLHSVAAPLSVLCGLIFGTRLWTSTLAHAVLLSVALRAFWLQQKSAEVRGLMRLLTWGFALLATLAILSETGSFDTWRYIAILMGSVGLLPLFVLSATVDDEQAKSDVLPRHSLVGMVLMANNAALLIVVVLLSNF
jgi:hypothetical protein